MCSCAKTAQRFEPERYIDAGFILLNDGYEIRGTVKVFSYEDIIFSFSYPESLSYLTLRVSSEGYFADIGGSEDEILPDALPDNAPIKLFAESIKAFLFEQNEFNKNENGEYLTEREILGSSVNAAFASDGKIKEITCDKINISFSFSEKTGSVG